MPELHDLLERRASGYEPSHDLFDRLLDRRRRRDRNRRVATVVVAMAVAATAIAVLALAFLWGAGTRPADQTPSPIVGAWASTNYNDGGSVNADLTTSSQTMTIRAEEDGVLHITVHGVSPDACSNTPTTMTGTGRLEDPTTLVVPSPSWRASTEATSETPGSFQG